jgi:hypothetical protein
MANETYKAIHNPAVVLKWLRNNVVIGRDDECWPTVGHVRKNEGYSIVSQKSNQGQKIIPGHRVMWELFNGPIPENMVIDHMCHNEAIKKGECGGDVCLHRRCVNPHHLVLATGSENLLRGLIGPRENTGKCRSGLHEWNEENILYTKGRRLCKLCARNRYHKNSEKYNETKKSKRRALKEASL